MKQYIVTGMSCAACQARVEKAVSAVPGVTACAVSLLTNSMSVEGDAAPAEIVAAVERAGYGAKPRGQAERASGNAAAEAEELLRDVQTPRLKRRLAVSVAFLLALMYITMGHNMWGWPLPGYFTGNPLGLALAQLLLAAAVMAVNRQFFVSGCRALLSRAPNMDTLVALGSAASFGWSTFVFFKMCGMAAQGADGAALTELCHNELYYESAAMIPALITVGKLLEALSKGKTTDALKSLIRLAPQTATVLRDGAETQVPVAQVASGDVFAVRPGESIPVDGVVLEGESAVNEAALTGESVPADKQPGDGVSAGTINQSGYLKCRATRVGEDTALNRIIRMVADAAATKAPIARIADKVSGVFVPAVIGVAAVVTVGWLIAGKEVGFALARGISVLVISCPCALGLATPVAVMAGNGLGARNGILIKTGEALENVGKLDTVALDKTGTVTQGEPKATDVIPAGGVPEEYLLRKAYALECKSEHPLAKAVAALAEERGLSPEDSEGFRALPGNGLEALAAGKRLRGGNRAFIEKYASDAALFARGEALAAQGKTPLYFAEDDRPIGLIAVADVIKETSPEAVAQLKRLGLNVVMLTGDNEKTARAIGEQAGVTDVVAGVLPEGKEAAIRRLRQSGRVAMVGDGVNDAPALTRADVGIAIGAGTDVAIDSADIVLMNSDLSDVAAAVRLGRGTLRNIRENLFWAFFYNLICIPLAAGLFGWQMKPMIGAAAMSLSSVTVCLNALRLNLLKIRDPGRDRPRRRSPRAAKNEPPEPERISAEKLQPEETQPAETTVTLRIGGMMCPHCEAAVKTALEALDFVGEASASHESGTAAVTLTGPYDPARVKEAVEAEGYTVEGTE